MKNILIVILLVLCPKINYAQAEIGEKIQGQWIFNHTKSTVQLPDGTAADKESGPEEKMTIYFKSDNTGNFNFTDRDSEKFTWVISKNRITIAYAGENPLCKSFSNDFKVILREKKGSQKLDLVKGNFSISLSR